MVRLYVNQRFNEHDLIKLPEAEWHYYKNVRRGKGSVCLFNRFGEVATGVLRGSSFHIECVHIHSAPLHAIDLAVALPDAKVIPDLIRSLSELGIRSLFFFKASRSQAALSRLKDFGRFERIALEACRQCGRRIPLEIKTADWKKLAKENQYTDKWFLDEVEIENETKRTAELSSLLIIIGCEGGWTTEERDEARKNGFRFIHLETPILRVNTAAIAASTLAIDRMGLNRHASRKEY